MKKNKREPSVPEFLIAITSAFLASLGLCLFSYEFIGMSYRFPATLTLTACIAAMAITLGIAAKPRILLFAGAVIAAPLLLLLLFTDLSVWLIETSRKFFIWLPPFLGGIAPAGQNGFESFLYYTILIVITLLCYFCFVRLRNMLLSFAVVLLPILLLQIFIREDLPLVWLIPSVIGLSLMMMITSDGTLFAKKENERNSAGFVQSIPFVLILTLIGLIAIVTYSTYVPASALRSNDVADMTDDTLSFLNIPLPESGGRKTFNLGSLGFYPLHNRLGGPVSVSNDEVMIVEASDDLLIRAITYNVYAKHYWSSSNYMFSTRFDSQFLINDRVDFFDSNRPRKDLLPADLYAFLFEKSSIQITMKNEITGGTLFTPDHVLDIRIADKTAYYNQSGEVYLRNGVDKDQVYEVDFIRFRTESPTYIEDLLRMEAYLIEHPEARDSESKIFEIRENNLTANVPTSVKDYALEVTKDATTPLERVFALRENLLSEFTYNLDVEVPPQEIDFVEHFLATKEGYCTYFASAMTMMARAVDVPAHYVEGFVVNVPEGSDDARVSVAGRHAHAWCEVYIDGIGWIPIDATASSGGEDLSFSEELGGRSESSYDGSGYGDAQGDMQYRPGEDSSPDLPQPVTKREPMSPVLIIVFISLSVVAFCLSVLVYCWTKWTRFFSLTGEKVREAQGRGAKISWIWKRCLRYLSLLAIRAAPAETPRDFAKRITEIPIYLAGCRKDTYSFDIAAITDSYERYLYGGKDLSAEEIDRASACLEALAKQIRTAHHSPLIFILRLLVVRQSKNI